MFRGKATLDWQVLEEGDKSDPDFFPMGSESRPGDRKSRTWAIAGLLAIIFLATSVAGNALITRAEENISHVQAEIEDAIAAESWVRKNNEKVQLIGPIEPRTPAAWKRSAVGIQSPSRSGVTPNLDPSTFTVEGIELQGDLAMVEVLVQDSAIPWLTAPYRQIQFYRQTEHGWRRTTAQTVFWGAERHLETAHFRFEYHRRDTQVVRYVADRIEDLYAEQRRLLGLDPAQPETKIAIVVAPAAEPRADAYCVRFSCDRPVVPSPYLLPLHEKAAPEDALFRLVATALSLRSFEEVLWETRPLRKSMWHPIVLGLTQWTGTRYNDLPSQSEYVRRGYVKEWLTANPVPSLTTLTGLECLEYDMNIPLGPKNCNAAASTTMIDYAVTHHGAATLPLLLDGLSRHDTWESLIPAVYGVPVDEFEMGWRAYVAEHYREENR